MVYCGAFLCLGFLIAALGPSLPTIGRNTNTSDEKMGASVTSRAFGYLTGSISGPLFHKLPGNRMLAAALGVNAIFCFIVPHLTSFALLCFLLVFQGICMGMLDTGSNLLVLWLHGEGCDPYIQSLHAFFAVGAVIGPAIIKALLSANTPINAAWYTVGVIFVPIVAALLYFESPTEPQETHEMIKLEDIDISTKDQPKEGQEVAEIRVGVDPLGESSTVPEVNTRNNDVLSSDQHDSSSPSIASLPSTSASKPAQPIFNFSWANRYNVDYKPYLMVLGIALFLGCYIGGEVATGSFLTTFALRRGLTTEDGGALISMLFWLAFAIGRLVAIPISIYVSPRKIIIADLIGTLISACFVWSFVKLHVPFTIAIFCYGFCLASTFPTAITLLQTIIPVTGNMTTVFIIGAALGEMLVPLMVSSTFEKTNYMSLIYVQFGSVAAGTLVMAGVGLLGHKIVQQQRLQKSLANKIAEVELQPSAREHAIAENGEEEDAKMVKLEL